MEMTRRHGFLFKMIYNVGDPIPRPAIPYNYLIRESMGEPGQVRIGQRPYIRETVHSALNL